MRAGWLSSVGLALGVCAGAAGAADDVVWRAAAPPAVTIGQPVPIATGRAAAPPPAVTPVSWSGAEPARPLVVRAQADPLPPPVPPPVGGPPAAPYVPPSGPYVPPSGPYVPPSGPYVPPPPPPPGIVTNPGDPYANGMVPGGVPPPGSTWWDKTKGVFDLQSGPFCGSAGRKPFQSDHCFDGFISPVSNPFLFEDPRSLTEVRPQFIYEKISSKNIFLKGGNLEFFGVQARVALTENWSIVMNKLGWWWVNPNRDTVLPLDDERSGFAGVNIGPKWTFLRNTCSGTLGAVGLVFEIPTSNAKVFQDSDGLALFPYLTFGQNFWRTSYGSMNALAELGYSFAVEGERRDFFLTSLHLDYDIGNLHKFYPLLELNWRYFTGNGQTRFVEVTPGHVVSVTAADITGHNDLVLAPGMRYKFNECFQVGTAFEFPLVGPRNTTENWRWTIDFIIRY